MQGIPQGIIILEKRNEINVGFGALCHTEAQRKVVIPCRWPALASSESQETGVEL